MEDTRSCDMLTHTAIHAHVHHHEAVVCPDITTATAAVASSQPSSHNRLAAKAGNLQDAHHILLNACLQCIVLELLHNLCPKGVHQCLARRLSINAARPEIKQLLLRQITDGAAVGALHVIRDDLQVGLHIDGRLGHQQQVAAELPGVRLLRVPVDLCNSGGCIQGSANMSHQCSSHHHACGK